MAAEMYNSNDSNLKATQGPGNANGRPIRPILIGVGAVIALILISLAISWKSDSKIPQSRSNAQVQRALPTTSATTADPQGRGISDTVSRPATTPAIALENNATSISGSSSLPVPGAALAPSPMASPITGKPSAGQNFVAPPGPATAGQETNR